MNVAIVFIVSFTLTLLSFYVFVGRPAKHRRQRQLDLQQRREWADLERQIKRRTLELERELDIPHLPADEALAKRMFGRVDEIAAGQYRPTTGWTDTLNTMMDLPNSTAPKPKPRKRLAYDADGKLIDPDDLKFAAGSITADRAIVVPSIEKQARKIAAEREKERRAARERRHAEMTDYHGPVEYTRASGLLRTDNRKIRELGRHVRNGGRVVLLNNHTIHVQGRDEPVRVDMTVEVRYPGGHFIGPIHLGGLDMNEVEIMWRLIGGQQ